MKVVFVKGFGWIKEIPQTFEQKLQVIRSGEEAGKEFIEEVIKDAQTQDALISVAKYLKNYPTDYLGLNTKMELYRECMNKLIKLAENDAAIQKWILKHSMMLIESVVDWV